MSLKDLDIKKSYINHGENNLVSSLINPALKESCLYRRSVGFFSSSVFNMIFDSLPYFVRNKGEIRLIASPNLSEEDIQAIDLGYKKKDEILKDRFLNEFESEIDIFNDQTLNTLYELVSNDILNIKIACVKNDDGIYHDKLGILTDKNNNHVVFYGSANSSISAYKNNYEKIRVVKSWDSNELESVSDEIVEFDNLWNNLNDYVYVITFKESIEKSILKIRDKHDLQSKAIKRDPIKLYDYQEKAIAAWKANGYKGFYVMATGTGKTWTAIYSAKELLKDKKSLIVIAAPYKHLVKQWFEDLEKVFDSSHIILISSENPNWVEESKRAIIANKYRPEIQVILITTIKSFYSDKFDSVIKMSGQEKLLIVDEAHRFTQRNSEFVGTYKYMLGLSATPINGKNNEEGKSLLEFFGGEVFSLPIEEALPPKNDFLVPYYYKPLYVYATDDEEKKVNSINRNIASCYSGGVLIDKEKMLSLSKARLRVIAMASEKNNNIDNLIQKVNTKDHFIIYCGDGKLQGSTSEEIRHILFVKEHLDSLGYSSSQFTADEDMIRRMQLVDMFNNNDINSLVAIRCLDEGINIPSIKAALIMASNDDYREFVQRRGRILRKFNGKKEAYIFDVIVLPTKESKIAEIELRRFYEYAKLAINKDELLKELDEKLSIYKLSLDDISFNFDLEEEEDLDE